MGEIRKWSPGRLYREVAGGPDEILFNYPSFTQASALMVVGTILAVMVAVDRETFHVRLGALESIVAGFFAVGMIRLAWIQKALRIGLEEQEIQYLRRTPFSDRQESIPFDDLVEVRLQEAASSSQESEKDFEVYLVTRSQGRIYLGKEARPGAANHGRRLSRYLRVPLRIPTD